jgi:hypothetical protein
MVGALVDPVVAACRSLSHIHDGPPSRPEKKGQPMRRRGPQTVPAVRAGALAIALCSCMLVSAGAAGAAEPWLAQMPTVEQVVAKTGGENASDTAARQWVAFDKLSLLTDKLLRDRMLEGTGLTPAERAIRESYGVNRDRITMQQQANLTAEGFSEWRKVADRYWADRHFNDSLLTLFSPRFSAANKQLLRETFEGAAIPGASPPASPAGPASEDTTTSSGGIPVKLTFILALLAGLGVRLFLQRARLELDPRDPFRLLLGGGTYVLNHATGSVDGASKMGTTNVYGGGGGANAYGYARSIRISSTTTIHDQFFLRQPGGAVETIKLQGWDFPVADGHVVSAVWAVREGAGAGPFVIVVNHTTEDTRSATSFLMSNLSRADGLRKLLVFCFLVAAGVVGSQITAGDSAKAALLAVLGALVGVFVGSVIWHSRIKLGLIRRFQRDGMPRIQEELHQRAIDAAPVPA